MSIRPYQDLANAIIKLAADDYRSALRNPTKQGSLDDIREIEKFFRSDHFSILTSVNPECLIKKLREEVANEHKNDRAKRNRISGG